MTASHCQPAGYLRLEGRWPESARAADAHAVHGAEIDSDSDPFHDDWSFW